MSANVPTISVTEDTNKHDYQNKSTSSDSESDSESFSNDMNYKSNEGGGLTDVEDLDSNAEFDRSCSRRSSKNSLFVLKDITNTQGDATDIEDYNDSEADDYDIDKSGTYPERKLSLAEFLRNDIQEHFSTTNGLKEVVEHKSGDFLQAQNLNANSDYLTDCEEYNTDSEIETKCEKSVCVDLNEAFIDQGRLSIAETTLATKERDDSDCEYEDVSEISDISDLASAISDIMGKDMHHGQSEDEMLEFSGNEEVCEISCSDSNSSKNHNYLSEEDVLSSASLPPIDVTFMQPCNRARQESEQFGYSTLPKRQPCKGDIYLKVEENKKVEVLTDIERFDDSVAEDDDDSFDGDDDNQQPIPQAVILAIGDDGACHTDCEDIIFDDISEAAGSSSEQAVSVDSNAIPPPHREVVMLQENKYGDTITNVMPMNKEYQFGIYATLREECTTDSEEFSCAEDVDIQELTVNLPSRSPSLNNVVVMVEPDVTVANEVLKTHQSKRLEIIANTESVTDVEEFYMAGTNSRRKKVKTRTMSKNKSKYLEAPRACDNLSGGGTDIEDMDLSENELLPTNKPKLNSQQISTQSNHSLTDKATDIEDMTADDASFVSDIEPPQIDVNMTNLKDYERNSKNCVVSTETCSSSVSNVKHNKMRKITATHFSLDNELTFYQNQQQQQQQHTDIEDIQLPSDAEDCLLVNEEQTVDTVSEQLNEMLNECCSTVHDKCTNSFNVDAEKLHIKGMLRESHTDIEYVESDESAAKGSK